MKIKLSIMERLLLLEALPKEGSFITLKILRDLQAQVGFTEEELKNWEITTEGLTVKWNQQKAKEVEFEFGEKAQDIIQKALEKLDKTKKLTQNHLTLYEKFIN